jgi:hypothetical protein
MPKNAHPDSTFSSFLHNDWTQLQLERKDIGNQFIDPSVHAFANDLVDHHNGNRPEAAPAINPHYVHEPSAP